MGDLPDLVNTYPRNIRGLLGRIIRQDMLLECLELRAVLFHKFLVIQILLDEDVHQAIEESDEDKPGVIIDYDKNGNIVGLEVLEASKNMENPRSVEYAVAG